MIDAQALQFAGITPPETGNRTTCPKCSHARRKAWERCLVIRPQDWGVEVFCYHCGYTDGIAA